MRYASSSAAVMPINENGAYGEDEHQGRTHRNDQVHPEIPAISLLGHTSRTQATEGSSSHRFARAAQAAAASVVLRGHELHTRP